MPAPVPSRHSEDDAPVSSLSRVQLLEVLTDLVRDLERLDLALSADGIEAARTLRDGLIGQVRDQVIPRLQDADVPSVVVIGGSTGAGKSTLVNSVLGQEVSDAGVLRPTTRTPVLVANPEDMESLSEHPLTEVCRQEVSSAIPAGLALIDASDLDSVHEANRELAGRLLEAADLWLFVTTAARYGDQTPWMTLEEATRRETPIGVVLNRVPAKILSEVRRDLITRLQGLGLSEAPFFVIPDAGPHEGLLSGDGVTELREWLRLLAGRHRAAGLVRRTGRGVWSTLRTDLERLADDVDAQEAVAQDLEKECQGLRDVAIESLSADIGSGSAGQGATATRWITLASSGGPLASLAQGGRMRRGFLGRADRARAEGLAHLANDAREALTNQLQAAIVALSAKAERAWAEAGAGDRATRILGQGDEAVVTIDAWVGYLEANIEIPQSIRRLAPASVIDLLISAAAGVDGAVLAARRLGLEEQTRQAGTLLVEAVTEALTATVPKGAAISLAPAPGFAAALRLRSGELKPFTRPGATA
ncbi:ABC transporter [Actinomyces naeslundii]|uniref:ABC transporter n=1 Tax=Actinomyces naeslundii TaxID=1655 RepID=A0ABX3F0W0_ACTNA|nr:ABC transporter [Actinomyces naeslundii]OLO82001.1 ABC transporter [Actinomyces naeslundii]OLO84794.1 ABC transporter [Actinomyces naeslundii]